MSLAPAAVDGHRDESPSICESDNYNITKEKEMHYTFIFILQVLFPFFWGGVRGERGCWSGGLLNTVKRAAAQLLRLS